MRLFINYTHADLEAVTAMVETLRTGGHECWFGHPLLPGQDWEAALIGAIKDSDAVMYALSPDSVKAEWCLWAAVQAAHFGKPVMPVRLSAEATAPGGLARLSMLDGSDPAGLLTGVGRASEYRINPAEVPAPDHPRGIPAQAMSTGKPAGMREAEPPPADTLDEPPDWSDMPLEPLE